MRGNDFDWRKFHHFRTPRPATREGDVIAGDPTGGDPPTTATEEPTGGDPAGFSGVDQSTSNNSEGIQASNLDQPSSASESWQGSSAKLEPSQGELSGQIDQNSKNNDAQWIRVFKLIVYKPGATSAAAQADAQSAPGVGGFSVAGASAPTRALPTRGLVIPFPRTRTRSVVLQRRGVATREGDTGSGDPTGGDPPSNTGDPTGGDPPSTPTPTKVDTTAPAPKAETQTKDDAGDSGIDLSNLRCTFSVQKSTLNTPNILYARIYNLSPQTLAKVIAFTRVQVSAGYKYANFGLIFDGTVVQYRRGKENPVDTYLEIHAGDGDAATNNATVFEVLQKGGTQADMLQKIIAAKQKVDPNFHPEKVDQALYNVPTIRDQVYASNTKYIERQFSQAWDADHWMENGGYIVMKKSGYRDDEAVVLSPKTGLVGLPEVTPQGIQVKCLLNPKIRLGGIIKIDSSVLSGVAYLPGSEAKVDGNGNVMGGETGGQLTGSLRGALKGAPLETAFTSPVGRYKVLLMTISGDTRGNPWYCDMVCVALDGSNKPILKSNISNAWFRRASTEARGGAAT